MKLEDRIQLRSWNQLRYHDPAVILRRLREIEPMVAASDLPPEVKTLRQGDLKRYREGRDAALFCHGMAQAVGGTVYYSLTEAIDYDCVTMWQRGDSRVFTPVQLKELVPASLNPVAELNDLLASLSRYGSLGRTVVAVYLNRVSTLRFADIRIPSVQCGGIWLFGGASADQRQWFIYGDIMNNPRLINYEYPA